MSLERVWCRQAAEEGYRTIDIMPQSEADKKKVTQVGTKAMGDLISERSRIEVQNFQTAIKEYMSSKEKKLSKLIEYAEKLGIRDEVMKYVEVLV